MQIPCRFTAAGLERITEHFGPKVAQRKRGRRIPEASQQGAPYLGRLARLDIQIGTEAVNHLTHRLRAVQADNLGVKILAAVVATGSSALLHRLMHLLQVGGKALKLALQIHHFPFDLIHQINGKSGRRDDCPALVQRDDVRNSGLKQRLMLFEHAGKTPDVLPFPEIRLQFRLPILRHHLCLFAVLMALARQLRQTIRQDFQNRNRLRAAQVSSAPGRQQIHLHRADDLP